MFELFEECYSRNVEGIYTFHTSIQFADSIILYDNEMIINPKLVSPSQPIYYVINLATLKWINYIYLPWKL